MYATSGYSQMLQDIVASSLAVLKPFKTFKKSIKSLKTTKMNQKLLKTSETAKKSYFVSRHPAPTPGLGGSAALPAAAAAAAVAT